MGVLEEHLVGLFPADFEAAASRWLGCQLDFLTNSHPLYNRQTYLILLATIPNFLDQKLIAAELHDDALPHGHLAINFQIGTGTTLQIPNFKHFGFLIVGDLRVVPRHTLLNDQYTVAGVSADLAAFLADAEHGGLGALFGDYYQLPDFLDGGLKEGGRSGRGGLGGLTERRLDLHLLLLGATQILFVGGCQVGREVTQAALHPVHDLFLDYVGFYVELLLQVGGLQILQYGAVDAGLAEGILESVEADKCEPPRNIVDAPFEGDFVHNFCQTFKIHNVYILTVVVSYPNLKTNHSLLISSATPTPALTLLTIICTSANLVSDPRSDLFTLSTFLTRFTAQIKALSSSSYSVIFSSINLEYSEVRSQQTEGMYFLWIFGRILRIGRESFRATITAEVYQPEERSQGSRLGVSLGRSSQGEKQTAFDGQQTSTPKFVQTENSLSVVRTVLTVRVNFWDLSETSSFLAPGIYSPLSSSSSSYALILMSTPSLRFLELSQSLTPSISLFPVKGYFFSSSLCLMSQTSTCLHFPAAIIYSPSDVNCMLLIYLLFTSLSIEILESDFLPLWRSALQSIIATISDVTTDQIQISPLRVAAATSLPLGLPAKAVHYEL